MITFNDIINEENNKLCGGYTYPPVMKIEDIDENINEKIDRVRKEIKEAVFADSSNDIRNYHLYFGHRFDDNTSVLARMNSIDPEKAKVYENNIDGFILDAFIDCMDADYYYAFEKDYGE